MKGKFFAVLLSMFMSVSLMAQTKVTGVVKDNVGPLVGVSVVEQGTTNGTVTNSDGTFALTVKPNATLILSSIGYKDQLVPVLSKTHFEIIMEEDAELLEETVVVGYGTQKKSDITGSVASVDAEQMSRRTPIDVVQGLQGAAAGVVITQSSGDPSGGFNIRIRGVATMNGNTDPLWVVDGIQYGNNSNLSWLDPQDVESIEILKDASSTAIYGARGANGVIMVTTKKGKAGKVRVDVKADFGVSTYADRLDVASLDLWLDAYRRACINDGYTPFNAFNGDYDDQLNAIDWQDVMTQTSTRQKYNISISGGSDNIRSNFSIGYTDNKGIIVNTWNKRLTMRLNTDFNITRWLKAGVNISFSTGKNSGGGNMINYARVVPTMDYVDNATGKLVNVPVQYEDGTFGHFTFDDDVNFTAGKYASNPYADKMYRSYKKDWDNDNGSVRNSFYAEVTLMKGLVFRTNLNYDFWGNNSWSYNPAYIDTQYTYDQLNGEDPVDQFSVSGSAGTNMGAENYLTYSGTFGAHSITAMIGQSASISHGSWSNASTKDLTFSFLRGFYSTNSKDYNDGNGAPNISTRFASYFARLNYSLYDRYLLTATIRRDGSSNFGATNRWGTFPSFSFAWKLDEEPWIKKLNFFDTLKLRAGWGQTGNANVDATASVPQLSSSGISYDVFDPENGYSYSQIVGIAQTSEIDTGLKWETSQQTNIGLDMSILKNSLSLSVDYYIRDTKDLILYKAIRPSAGFSGITTNFGSIRNSGFEIALGYKKQLSKDWFLSASLTGSTNKNEAVEIGTGSTSSGPTGSAWEDKQVCYNGLPLGTYQGYMVDGIFQNQSEVDELNANAAKLHGEGTYWDKKETAAGDFRYKDLNGDGRITVDDKTYLGDGFAKFNYGLNLYVTYKNFDASMYMYGALGQKILSWAKCYLTAINNESEGYYNLLADAVKNAWTPELGEKALYPRISKTDLAYNKRVSDFFVENGNYLKISNFQVGYNFRFKGIRNARVYFSINNLATFSPYKKYGDPEVSGGVTTSGYDSGRYPFPRTYMFGIQFGL